MTKQQAPAVHPASRPRAKAPSSRGQYIDFRPRQRQVVKKTAVRQDHKPIVKKAPATSEQKKEIVKNGHKPASTSADKPVNTVTTISTEQVTIETIATADKDVKSNPLSPFINSVNVDKRPLSSRRVVADNIDNSGVPTVIREEDFHGEIKSPYTTRRNIQQKDPHKKLRGEKGSKSSRKEKGERGSLSISFIIAVILTVILGAAVGAFVYLAFFQ